MRDLRIHASATQMDWFAVRRAAAGARAHAVARTEALMPGDTPLREKLKRDTFAICRWAPPQYLVTVVHDYSVRSAGVAVKKKRVFLGN